MKFRVGCVSGGYLHDSDRWITEFLDLWFRPESSWTDLILEIDLTEPNQEC